MGKQATTLVGFAVLGAVMGYVFGSGARSATPSAVSTTRDGATVGVKINLGTVLQGGLDAIVGR